MLKVSPPFSGSRELRLTGEDLVCRQLTHTLSQTQTHPHKQSYSHTLTNNQTLTLTNSGAESPSHSTLSGIIVSGRCHGAMVPVVAGHTEENLPCVETISQKEIIKSLIYVVIPCLGEVMVAK